MPQEQQLAHRNVQGVGGMPYVTNTTPTDTNPMFVSGSTDLLTSISGILQRRPGFADALEPTPTVFNNLQRLFSWDRFDGTFIEMACDVNSSGFAQVFKRVIGADSSFVSIFTDTVGAVFDFIVSNNTVYFSNGHVAKKWTPTSGISNWGIAIAAISNPTNAYAGTGANGTGTPTWTNPTNIQGAPDSAFATNSFTVAPHILGTATGNLNATNYGFALTVTNAVVGVQVTVTGFSTQTGFGSQGVVGVQLIVGGNLVGNIKTVALPTSSGAVILGSSSDLWGTSVLNGTSINASNFGVALYGAADNTSGSSSTYSFSLDAAQITVFQLGGPVVSLVTGTLTATVGYEYVFCYGNSVTGHISSPTPASASIKPTAQGIQIGLVASADAQVNQIRLFRTTDSAAAGTTGGTFFELPTSPYPNTTANVTDNAVDTALNVSSIAPIPGFNDPPTPILGMRYFSGRIWGFANNKVYFSGLEEIPNGVPEESFPSGPAGNFWSFDQPCQALGLAGLDDNQKLGVFCGGRVYAISGNTLDTFRRKLISNRRGCRSRTLVSELGGMLAWIDSSLQVWATNGTDLKELGLDIRPSLVSNIPASFTNSAITFHASGAFHWLVCNFAGTIFVYDLDLEQWMPPWTANLQYIFSGETSPGNYVLMGATATKALALNTSKFNDNGSTYQPIIRTNLFSMVPDYGKRFSYIGVGSYDQPSRTGVPWTVQLDTNTFTPADVALLTDDDPTVASPAYQSIASGLKDPSIAFNRKQGVNLLQNVYETNGPAARWAGLKMTLANADQQDKIYNWYVAYKELGGR